MTSKQEFARRLFDIMTNRGLLQADLAQATGLSRNNISTYIRGQCLPSPLSLQILATALDCTTDELLPEGFYMGKATFEREQIYETALRSLLKWGEAYPTSIFPEPDLVKARALLEAGGMTLDSVSASAMRHVANSVVNTAMEALEYAGK